MHCIYNKKSALTAISLVLSVLHAGCQTATGPAYGGYNSNMRYVPPAASQDIQQPQQNTAGLTPSAPYVPALVQQQQMAYLNQYQTMEATTTSLKDRLERVEKALIRLDRRMQLVERNELSRMSDNTSGQSNEKVSSLGQVPMSVPMSRADEQAAMQGLDIGPPQNTPASNGYMGGFQPVSNKEDTTIRAALQAAPEADLPSLADMSPSSGKAPQAATDVAVWTVRYDDPGKVWPDRAQLPYSRDVVEALRDSGTVTVFARGPNPNDKQFRERVKALSRYLSKVSSVDSVPIAALPSPQLDAQTIEILATH